MPPRARRQRLRRPVWALLSPIDRAPLEETVAAVMRRQHPGLEPTERDWAYIACEGSYSALVSFEPGSEGAELPLVDALAGKFAGDHLFLHFAEDHEIVWVYRNGRRVGERDDSPWDVAAQLGCPIPGTPDLAPLTVTSSVCFVEGATPEDAARALGLERPPTTGPLHIEPTIGGVVVYSERGNAAIFAHKLSSNRSRPVYLLSARARGAELYAEMLQDGETVGIYEYPRPVTPDLPRLTRVANQTEPAAIARTLNIPLHLLGLVDDGT